MIIIVYFGVTLRLQLHSRDDFVLFLLIFYSILLNKRFILAFLHILKSRRLLSKCVKILCDTIQYTLIKGEGTQ
ncbi:hypothetical protein COC96_26390 [Bacillus cereus]|nr:hypothetical protein COC96_26390 [Bacillus cereus]